MHISELFTLYPLIKKPLCMHHNVMDSFLTNKIYKKRKPPYIVICRIGLL